MKNKLAAAIFGSCILLLISTSQAGDRSDDAINVEVNAARDLIESWSGQRAILDQARERLTRVLEADPRNYRALKELARYQMAAGYTDSRRIQLPTHHYLLNNYVPGTLERAEWLIRNAIQIEPRFADGYVVLAEIQIQQSKFDESARSLASAEAIGTDEPQLDLIWAGLHSVRGEDAAAKKRWQRVLDSSTARPASKLVANKYLIQSYKQSGEHEKAIALYRTQIKSNPTNAWFRAGFADYLTDTLGRNDDAIQEAREALKIMNFGRGQETLGMALYRKWADLIAEGNDAAAEIYFQEAQKLYPLLNEVMAYGASMPAGRRLAQALTAKKAIPIDARVSDGSTALLIATNRNTPQVVKMLLELNANPNIPDKTGWTPLLSAADLGNAEVVNMLLAKGADIRARLGGADSVTMAERSGNASLATLLRQRAAGQK